MVNIRINNDVPIRWHIKHNGENAILQGKELELKVCNTFGCTAITDYIINGSELSFVFSGSAQKYLGDYHLTLKIKDGNNVYTVDACKAFRLVALSCEVEDNAIVEVESNITVPRNGFSAYELAVLNGYPGTYDEWVKMYAGLQPTRISFIGISGNVLHTMDVATPVEYSSYGSSYAYEPVGDWGEPVGEWIEDNIEDE